MKKPGRILLSIILIMSIVTGVSAVTVSTAAVEEVTKAAEELEIGDYITVGKYYDEPILWRCVNNDDNGMLILSDRIICFKPFDVAGDNVNGSHGRGSSCRTSNLPLGSNYWGDSNIRSWLNSSAQAGEVEWLCGNPPYTNTNVGIYNGYAEEKGFLANGNFTESERRVMKEVSQKCLLDPADAELAVGGNVEAWEGFEAGIYKENGDDDIIDPAENRYNAICYENVTDTVFLLDIQQCWSVYQNENILGKRYRHAKPTQTAIDNNAKAQYSMDLTGFVYMSTDDEKSYLLRTPYGLPHQYNWDSLDGNNRIITDLGGVYHAKTDNGGIRPAFYLDEANAEILSGSGTAEDPYVLDGKPEETNNESKITVFCNGSEVLFDQSPVLENDRVLVPMRAIFEALGAEVTWEETTRTAAATLGETQVSVQIDNAVMLKNGETVELDAPPRLIGERTLVPVRAVSEGLGATVDWNEQDRRVIISQAGHEALLN